MNNNFHQYKYGYIAATELYEIYYKNIPSFPIRWDFFQIGNIDFGKYSKTFNYPGSFTLRTRNASVLQHLYATKEINPLLGEITDTENQYKHNYYLQETRDVFFNEKKKCNFKYTRL